jgi:hypothetical protein
MGVILSANDPRVLAGLGSASKLKLVRVRWPDGTVAEFKDVLVDRYNTVEADQMKVALLDHHAPCFSRKRRGMVAFSSRRAKVWSPCILPT